MKNYRAHMEAKVRGQNEINSFFNRVVPIALAELKRFVGKQIVTSSGGLFASVRTVQNEIAQSVGEKKIHFYFNHSNYSLWMEGDSTTNVQGDSGCHYMHQTFCLGSLQDGVLTSLRNEPENLPNFRTDLDVDSILAILKEADALEKKASDLRFTVVPFNNGLHGN